jgi:hypothetical protein
LNLYSALVPKMRSKISGLTNSKREPVRESTSTHEKMASPQLVEHASFVETYH